MHAVRARLTYGHLYVDALLASRAKIDHDAKDEHGKAIFRSHLFEADIPAMAISWSWRYPMILVMPSSLLSVGSVATGQVSRLRAPLTTTITGLSATGCACAGDDGRRPHDGRWLNVPGEWVTRDTFTGDLGSGSVILAKTCRNPSRGDQLQEDLTILELNRQPSSRYDRPSIRLSVCQSVSLSVCLSHVTWRLWY